MSSDELVPVPGSPMPSPADVHGQLLDRLRAFVYEAQIARGGVHRPEDVYALVRDLGAAHDRLTEYARAFTRVARVAKGFLEEEHVAAVGEQDDIPLSNLTVPDTDGTELVFTRDMPNSYDIDVEALIGVVAADTVDRTRDTDPPWADDMDQATYTRAYEEWLTRVLVAGMDQLVALGAFTPGVAKTRLYATDLAGVGKDSLSGVVSSAIRKTTWFKGIKLARRQRKKGTDG